MESWFDPTPYHGYGEIQAIWINLDIIIIAITGKPPTKHLPSSILLLYRYWYFDFFQGLDSYHGYYVIRKLQSRPVAIPKINPGCPWMQESIPPMLEKSWLTPRPLDPDWKFPFRFRLFGACFNNFLHLLCISSPRPTERPGIMKLQFQFIFYLFYLSFFGRGPITDWCLYSPRDPCIAPYTYYFHIQTNE